MHCRAVGHTHKSAAPTRMTSARLRAGLAAYGYEGRVPRPATGGGLGVLRQRWSSYSGGLPVTRPMRGDMDATFGRCLSGVGRSLQAYCAARGFLAGKSAPERCDPAGTSPPPVDGALWIGWQRGFRVRFWPHMAERCADQDDLEHGCLRLGGRCRCHGLTNRPITRRYDLAGFQRAPLPYPGNDLQLTLTALHLHRSAPSAGTPADREFANPDADCSGLRSGTGTIVRGTARKSVAWMVLTDAASVEVIGALLPRRQT